MSAVLSKGTLVLLMTLLVAPVFAGCFGDKDKADPSKDGDGNIIPGVSTPTGTQGPPPEDHTKSSDPKAHYHHLWKDRTEVTLWKDADIEFKTFDTKYLGDYNSMVWAEFNLEMDGDQVSDPEASDAAPDGRADVLFAGTKHIEVTFPDELFPGAQSLKMFWKPANTNVFGGGILAQAGETHYIPFTQQGMADPPHQNAVSRWRFRLVLFDTNPACELGLPACPPAFSTATPDDPERRIIRMPDFGMKAIKGSEETLDPPHPDFWGPNTVIAFQSVSRTMTEPVLQTPVFRERSPALIDVAPLPGDLVPLGTERVEITVGWTMENAPEGFLLKLKYHGADTIEYAFATPKDAEKTGPTASNTYVVYNVVDGKDQGLVDPPYESRSFWRYELVPTVRAPDGTDVPNLGAFLGTYTIDVSLYRDADFILS